MRLVDAAVTWTAVSTLVTPFVGQLLARRRVEMSPEDLVASHLCDRASAAPLDL
jgi:hypothetical protein